MASKVVVPADFGKYRSTQPGHGNIYFIFKRGKQIKANSIIMSLNSPVIKDRIKNQQLNSFSTTFGRKSVRYFIDAVYTGGVGVVHVNHIINVMKIAQEFQVSWLVAKCEYLVPFIDKLDCETSRFAIKHAKSSRAPKVSIPIDFGRHLIGAPEHENLPFVLDDGTKIKANSIILALNSPVINDLISRRSTESITAENLSKEAVDCFIEATYTGRIDALNLENFRHVNKMSRMFKVSWLSAKCEEYFVSFSEMLNNESSYSDMLFAVEEAVFMSAVNNGYFLNLVSEQMATLSEFKRKNFIQKYTFNLNYLSSHKIDNCIAVVKSEVHLLAELLTAYLKVIKNKGLNKNSRHLLRTLDMAECYQVRPDLYAEIFHILESLSEVSRNDFKLFVSLQKQNTEHSIPITPRQVILLETPQHWNQSFNIDEFFEELSAREDITSLYSLIDGIWMKLYGMKKVNVSAYYRVIKKTKNLAKKHGWQPVNKDYTSCSCFKSHTTTEILIGKLNSFGNIVSKSSDVKAITVLEYSQHDFVEELFYRDNMFKFHIPGDHYAGQTFVLLSSAVKYGIPDSFDLRWCLFDLPAGHSPFTLPKLHFALIVERGGSSCILPITWCGQPACKKYIGQSCWNWGYIRFHRPTCPLELRGDAVCGGSVTKYAHILSSDTVKMVAFEIR